MSEQRTISAPGKLFLSGEYAVLWGGTSRLLAVGPRVMLAVRRRSDRRVDLLRPDGRLSGTATIAGVRWDEPVSAEFLFAARTVDVALRASGLEGPGFTVAFEPSPTVHGQKLGLGSSARTAVLTAEAVRWALHSSFDALKVALIAHADAQNGKGSGADVVTVFAGGLVKYRRYDATALLEASRKGALRSALEGAPPVEVARLHSGSLPVMYAFTGSSASTTELVGKAERQLDAAARERFVASSDLLGHELEVALGSASFGDAKERLQKLQALLWSLGSTQHEGTSRLLDLAAGQGCAAKQSGAGGGDGVIVVAPNQQAAEAFVATARARGFMAMQLSIEDGLRGEARPPGELELMLSSV